MFWTSAGVRQSRGAKDLLKRTESLHYGTTLLERVLAGAGARDNLAQKT